jgi:hypothetical protein
MWPARAATTSLCRREKERRRRNRPERIIEVAWTRWSPHHADPRMPIQRAVSPSGRYIFHVHLRPMRSAEGRSGHLALVVAAFDHQSRTRVAQSGTVFPQRYGQTAADAIRAAVQAADDVLISGVGQLWKSCPQCDARLVMEYLAGTSRTQSICCPRCAVRLDIDVPGDLSGDPRLA